MKRFFLATALALCGCAGPTPVPRQELQPVGAGQRVELARAVRIIETRAPLALKLEWRLLPGRYVERYASPAGRVFISDGRLVQFTGTTGEITFSVGGFIVLKDPPGTGKLYVIRGSGDLRPITDFPLSELGRPL